ncbi:hypothetical protein ACFWVB_20240 [Streptomyces microflavus]|uniref:hypothetical protein n=1 Tax=Streptomyces microflavus TaxID=1919 RepID=UPI0036570460
MADTGIPLLETVLVWGGALTILGGLGAVLWRAARGVVRTGRRMNEFMDDWYGEGPRPGVPARPGLMERVSGMEDRLSGVEHELHPNDGGSLRDAVDQANRRLANLCPDRLEPPRRPPPAT